MHENQRVDPALGDQPRGDDGLSKSGRGGKNAGVVGQEFAGGHRLLGVQVALEFHVQRLAAVAFVSHHHVDAQIRQQLLDLVEATPRQTDVPRVILRAGDNAWLAVGR